MSMPEHIGYTVTGAVATITTDRPEKRHAIALQTADELCTVLALAEGDPDVRAVVLTGAGDRAFASGADLDELRDAMASAEGAAAYDAHVSALYRALRESPLPVVARIQGHAIGGGCLLALACDLRVAAPGVTLGLPVSRIGLMLSPVEHERLVRQVGPSRAKMLLFTGRRLDAREAADWGLVDVVADDGGLDEVVDGLVAEIIAGAPIAVGAAKRLVDAALGGGDDETVDACYRAVYGSADLKEGLAAAKERRKPVFRGR
jgi:enoyl-CoA hydratase/carnithine racemase